jgi:hypothetical protein
MSPEPAVETTAAAGGDLFNYARMYTVEGAKLDAPAKAGDWLMQQTYDAGTVLIRYRARQSSGVRAL